MCVDKIKHIKETKMDFLMEILYFLQELRNPVFDFFFELITKLGEETFFLVIAILFFWCINKREGYFILLTGLFGTILNQALKLIFRIPRPWKIDTSLESVISEEVRLAAGGYSFPSGHTQNIASTFGAIAAYKKGGVRTAVCVTVILLVAFSRMYLGVHTLLDVGVSLFLAFGLVVGLRPLFASENRFKRSYPFIVIGASLCSLAFLIYVLCLSGDKTLDPDNYLSGLKNACTLLGCTLGLIGVYFADTYFVKFETEAKWYSQIIKAVLGFAIVLLIKEGLRAPLEFVFVNVYVARTVRYLLVVAFAGILWPMTFKFFKGLTIPALDRFGERVKNFFCRKKNAENAN